MNLPENIKIMLDKQHLQKAFLNLTLFGPSKVTNENLKMLVKAEMITHEHY